MPEEHNLDQDAKFNAGISIALDIFNLFKQAEYFASMGDYEMWFIKLEAIERKMWTRFREKQDARNEVEKIKKEGMNNYKLLLKKIKLGKDVNKKKVNVGDKSVFLVDVVQKFLSDYEKCLIFWRDKFGYGMPLKEDMRKAAWR